MPSAIPQSVDAQLTRAAIFLVVTVNAGSEHAAAVRSLCGNLAALIRGVGFRALDGRLSCVMGFGSDAWDRLFGAPKPKELHRFREIRGRHHAVATPGDILFHIRAARMDPCFQLAAQIMSRLRGAASLWQTRCTASTISMNATCSASSMELGTGRSGSRRRHPHPRWRMPLSPAEAM